MMPHFTETESVEDSYMSDLIPQPTGHVTIRESGKTAPASLLTGWQIFKLSRAVEFLPIGDPRKLREIYQTMAWRIGCYGPGGHSAGIDRPGSALSLLRRFLPLRRAMRRVS